MTSPRRASLLLLIVVAGVIAGCSNNGQDSAASSGPQNDLVARAPHGVAAGGTSVVSRDQLAPLKGAAAGASGSSRAGGSAEVMGAAIQRLPVIGPKVIKTASVSIRVGRGKLEGAVQSTVAAAAGHNGYVVSTDVEGVHSNVGTVVIRVPSDRFETALSVIKDLGAVTRETVTGNDVTQQFIDLGARLRNFSAQERVMLDLMRHASTIDDTIRVEQQLQGVQLEIERIKGRMRYLRSQASFSTITASFAETGVIVSTGRPGTIARAWQKAGDVVLSVVSGVIVGAAVVIPIALLALLALLGFKIVRPKLGSTT